MTNLDHCYNISDLREIAKRRLPKGVFEYVDRGTEDEIALAENREAFKRIKLRTRFLTDLSKRDLGTEIFGKRTNLRVINVLTGKAAMLLEGNEDFLEGCAPTAEARQAAQSAPVEATTRAVNVDAFRPCSAVQIQ